MSRKIFFAMLAGLVVGLALVLAQRLIERRANVSERPLIARPHGRWLLRVSHEQEVWKSGGLFALPRVPGRSPLRPNVDVVFPPVRHGLANLELLDFVPPRAYTLFTNSKGFRTREFDWAKPPGTYRIVVLGDSTAFGHPLNPEDAFSSVLERVLRARLPTARRGALEVLNLAAPGSTLQSLTTLYEALKELETDVLIFGSAFNDYGYCQRERPIETASVPPHFWSLETAVPGQSTKRPTLSEEALRATLGRYGPEACPAETSPPDYQRLLRRLVQVARSRGAEPLYIYLEQPRRFYLAAARQATRELDVPFYNAPEKLLDAELAASETRSPTPTPACVFSPLKPRGRAERVRLRVRVKSPKGFTPEGGYSLVAQPLGMDVFKILPQAPWAHNAFAMGDDDGDGVFTTTVWVPLGESVKFFFLPKPLGQWRDAELPNPQSAYDLASRFWLTSAGELARYHRRCDAPDLYTTPVYVYGKWDFQVEAVHPNARGHAIMGEDLASRIATFKSYRKWADGH